MTAVQVGKTLLARLGSDRSFFLKSKSLVLIRVSSALTGNRDVLAQLAFDLPETSGISKITGGRRRRFQRPPSAGTADRHYQQALPAGTTNNGRALCSAWPQIPERGDAKRRVTDRLALCGAARGPQTLGRGRPPVRWVSNQQDHVGLITIARVIEPEGT